MAVFPKPLPGFLQLKVFISQFSGSCYGPRLNCNIISEEACLSCRIKKTAGKKNVFTKHLIWLEIQLSL